MIGRSFTFSLQLSALNVRVVQRSKFSIGLRARESVVVAEVEAWSFFKKRREKQMSGKKKANSSQSVERDYAVLKRFSKVCDEEVPMSPLKRLRTAVGDIEATNDLENAPVKSTVQGELEPHCVRYA